MQIIILLVAVALCLAYTGLVYTINNKSPNQGKITKISSLIFSLLILLPYFLGGFIKIEYYLILVSIISYYPIVYGWFFKDKASPKKQSKLMFILLNILVFILWTVVILIFLFLVFSFSLRGYNYKT